MKFPVLKYFKFDKIWQQQNFNNSEKNLVVKTAQEIDKGLINLSDESRNQLIASPSIHYDPQVTIDEWNDFLAVSFCIKPSCLIGHNIDNKTHNPIAIFAQSNLRIFPNISFANYWEFGELDINNNLTFDLVKDGFIYSKPALQKVINKYSQTFSDFDLEKVPEYLKKLSLNYTKNPDDFHYKIGLLLGYSLNEINKFIKNSK